MLKEPPDGKVILAMGGLGKKCSVPLHHLQLPLIMTPLVSSRYTISTKNVFLQLELITKQGEKNHYKTSSANIICSTFSGAISKAYSFPTDLHSVASLSCTLNSK